MYLPYQVTRLTKMAGGDMKADLKQWLWQRLRILKQVHLVPRAIP